MKRLFTSTFLVLALLAMTVGTVFAQEAAPITGTVQTVVLETNAITGETIVVVTVLDETGTTQIVKIDLQSAESLGLVVTDPITGVSTVALDVAGKAIEIDPTTIIDNGEEVAIAEKEHRVGSSLSDFFSELLGVNYETIMSYHEDGIGFGVIAQALWITNNLDGDTTTFEALLDAKQSSDYSAITLVDGSTPDNWGDVVKSLKKGNNLGSVMSGHIEKIEDANNDTTPVEVPANAHGNSGDNGSNDDKNKNEKGDDKGNSGNNGNGHGNGGGRP